MDNKKFNEWLRHNGAEVLEPTNPYEIARFVARGGVNVIYRGRRGISARGFALDCLHAFENNASISMGYTKGHRSDLGRKKAALMQRDGDLCFFCAKPMTQDAMTIEHLVSRQNGGPNHMDNLVLSHSQCNARAGNLPLIKKIQIHHSTRLTCQ